LSASMEPSRERDGDIISPILIMNYLQHASMEPSRERDGDLMSFFLTYPSGKSFNGAVARTRRRRAARQSVEVDARNASMEPSRERDGDHPRGRGCGHGPACFNGAVARTRR